MKKGFGVILCTLLCVLSAFFFWGCGGSGPGEPGSSGSADTGIFVRVSVVTHSDPNGDSGDNWDIDLAQDRCTETTVEPWGNDFMHVVFNGESLNSNLGSTNELFVTNYKVTFTKVNPDLPTIEQMSFGSQSGINILPGTATGPFSFLVLDFGRKLKIQNDLSSGINNVSPPLLYNMKVEMFGQDKFGNSVTFAPIERVIDIADFNHC